MAQYANMVSSALVYCTIQRMVQYAGMISSAQHSETIDSRSYICDFLVFLSYSFLLSDHLLKEMQGALLVAHSMLAIFIFLQFGSTDIHTQNNEVSYFFFYNKTNIRYWHDKYKVLNSYI